MASSGRNRQSIANIEEELHNLIFEHPRAQTNDAGEPVIPGDALVDILTGFSELHNDLELMTKDEEGQLIQFLASNPGLEVTPKVLVEFIAFRTTPSDGVTKEATGAVSSDEGSENDSPEERGRQEDRGVYDHHSRSSSTDSVGTSVYRPPSRPSSRGPPRTPGANDSPFDASKRQRSTPLGNIAPSSWTKRPPPAHRRKSDAGAQGRGSSDTESASSTPSSWARKNSRSRGPSNPTSPTITSYSQPMFPSDSFSPVNSPPSRPHSRSQSRSEPQLNFSGLSSYYGSPDRGGESPKNAGFLISPLSSSESSLDEASFLSSINSLPMPRSLSDSDSDSDDGEPSMLIYDRSTASSTASLEPLERMEALQRINTDLSKKLIEAEKTLQNRLTEHESELEEMQSKLEELKSELTATKKEEKELRAKERQNSTQISALESEIAKLQKSLENARSSYQSLQKQYQEQCTESERYRHILRRRDEEIKDHQDAAALHVLESQKWVREQMTFEDRIAHFEHELNLAQQAYVQLDDQKQQNLLLKETIDRMRFDMDEMRSNAANSLQQGGSGTNSAQGSLSRNFHAEMIRAGVEEPGGTTDDPDTSGETEVPDIENQDTESEDYIQTIITKTRKRKVPGRPALASFHLEETTKEYSDADTQYDYSSFHRPATSQTDPESIPVMASLSTQTDQKLTTVLSIQTDPEPVPVSKIMVEMEIQTDIPESEFETSNTDTQEDEDASASSSSTLLPPTPKAQSEAHLHDLPPAYNQVTHQDQDELALRIANETLKQWHKGAKLPVQPLQAGVSLDAVEEWKALKDELGVECMVIEKILEGSGKTGQPRLSSSSLSASTSSKDSSSSRTSRRGRFYNIYNTYVYGARRDSNGLVTNMLLCAGASAVAVFFMTHGSSQVVIPGGPTYYDRAAWSSFNTMHANGEGFAGDGTSVVWNFLSRLSGGAARIVQGWPT